MSLSTSPVFLTAQWRNLINLTYEVEPSLLEPHLPKDVEIDTQWNGKAHVSLIAFDFMDTRVKGLKIPFHVNFPEVNLRLYVRYQGQIGVVFIKEFVPKYCVAYMAQRLYNEPYEAISMASGYEEVALQDKFKSFYRFSHQGRNYEVEATGLKHLYYPPLDAAEHYFKEHSWGFGKGHTGQTMCYYVEHPVWKVFALNSYNLKVDFGGLYGRKWTFLNTKEPDYVLFAEGSHVKVYQAIPISAFPAQGLPSEITTVFSEGKK
jgi:uncharacterized protein YqjF (DUF2071 family)